jgi:hypothetical protein
MSFMLFCPFQPRPDEVQQMTGQNMNPEMPSPMPQQPGGNTPYNMPSTSQYDQTNSLQSVGRYSQQAGSPYPQQTSSQYHSQGTSGLNQYHPPTNAQYGMQASSQYPAGHQGMPSQTSMGQQSTAGQYNQYNQRSMGTGQYHGPTAGADPNSKSNFTMYDGSQYAPPGNSLAALERTSNKVPDGSMYAAMNQSQMQGMMGQSHQMQGQMPGMMGNYSMGQGMGSGYGGWGSGTGNYPS